MLSEILNVVLGGGFVAAVAGLVTMRATVVRANAEADAARANADGVKITNTESATQVLMTHIVDPLKEELNETRKEVRGLRREVARFRKAIDGANVCDYRDGCPVLERMREQQEGDGTGGEHGKPDGQRGVDERQRKGRGACGGGAGGDSDSGADGQSAGVA